LKENKSGIGETQKQQATTSRIEIAKLLADQKPHQFNELKKQSKLSAPTLSKHLKKFVTYDLVTKEIDTKSGRYPYPVYYTATPELSGYAGLIRFTEEMSSLIDATLAKEKNPLTTLNSLNTLTIGRMHDLLTGFKENKNLNLTVDDLIFKWALWVLEPYKALSEKILQATAKIIDEIDLDKDLRSLWAANQ
jgi:DNA-binding HxlR family transcriptional regulator